MQYILTQEEYDDLKKKRLDLATRHLTNLQRACTLAADHVPVLWGWTRPPEVDVPKPWGCLLTKDVEDPYGEWYCDKCPVQKECPYEHKSYSK